APDRRRYPGGTVPPTAALEPGVPTAGPRLAGTGPTYRTPLIRTPKGDLMVSRRSFITGAAAVAVTGASLAACGKKATSTGSGAGGTKTIPLGFSQVGSESGWRSANTDSIKSAAKAAGINLKFSDAQQKEENQIQAIRDYISQKVDVISFSP